MRHYYACIDTETTGLPIQLPGKRFYPYTCTDKYDTARLVSIAVVFYDVLTGKKVKEFYNLIRPNGFTIPDSEYHDVTQKSAMESGISLTKFMCRVIPYLNHTYAIIGHTVMFDMSVVASEMYRMGKHRLAQLWMQTPLYDTALLAKQFGFPRSLISLYKHLTGKEITNHHNALADALHCAECFFRIISSPEVRGTSTGAPNGPWRSETSATEVPC